MTTPEANLHKTSDITLISALRIIANLQLSDDSVIESAINEAANRIEELIAEIAVLKEREVNPFLELP